MPLSVTIPITTVTPIWTGDVNQKTEYLRATSFLGGLRFWTEGLCRSLGHKNICDITNSGNISTYRGINRDIYDSEDHPHVCLVCEIFGCTGKGRSFSLSLRVCDEKISNKSIGPIVLEERQYVVNGRAKIPRYLDGNPGKHGSFSLELTQMRPSAPSSELAAALTIMLNWGTLGAKDQYGYGLVKATLPVEFVNLAMNAIPPHDPGDAKTLDRATLRDFFFFCSTAKDYPEIRKRPFLIRHDIRNDPALRSDDPLRHYWGGKLNRFGTNFNLGITTDNAILGWGWFPRQCQFNAAQRDICLDALKREVINHSEPGTARWKEFGSSRDTCKSSGIWPDFLKDLISTSWR